jgi:hypothetical protein
MSRPTETTNMCAICVEPISLKTGKHKEITCLHCYKSACRTCYQTFILDETTPRCMYPDCGKEFSRKFICDNFTQSFVTGALKKHREDIYFEQEKALLPATQERVVDIIRDEEYKAAYSVMSRRIRHLRIIFAREKTELTVNTQYEMPRKDYLALRKVLRTQFHLDCQAVHNTFAATRPAGRIAANRDPEAGKHRFIRPCSDTGCKGFLSTAWKCGLCEKHACSKCHVVLVGDKKEHVCDPDTLSTAQLIVSQSKPCPGCHINISKIDGCNQMWCTICNTAWDWKSGRIETKVHNPHYFEYMRNRGTTAPMPRNPNEVLCGRELDNYFIRQINVFLDQIQVPVGSVRNTPSKVIEGIQHLDRFHIADVGASPDAVHLRIAFMRSHINEVGFKRSVQMLYKKFYKEKEIQEVLGMLKQMITDICYRYLEDLRQCANPQEMADVRTLDETEPLLEYVNESLKTIAKTYQSTVYAVSLDSNDRKIYGLKSVKDKTIVDV